MDFAPSPRAQELADRVRAFVDTEIEPVEAGGHCATRSPAARRGEDPWLPPASSKELQAKARADGPVEPLPARPGTRARTPREFGTDGGAGLSNVDYAPVAEPMGRSCLAPLRVQLQRPRHRQHGGAAQVRLARAEAGVARAAAGRPDPQRVPDDRAGGRRPPTRPTWRPPPRVDGDDVVLNGRKWWSTGAGHPDCKVFIFMGLTDPEADRHRRHSMVARPARTPGVKIERMLTGDGPVRRAARPRRGVA